MSQKLVNAIASQVRLMWFYLKQFAGVTYFIQLMLFTTVTTAFVQNMGVRAWGGNAAVMCNRAAVIGLWTTSVAAAGIIGLERYRGTLVHLAVGRISLPRILFAIISSASSFGLLAFPVAWGLWLLLDFRLDILTSLTAAQLLWNIFYIVLLWLGAVAVSSVVAAIFVLTPNAISYEELLLAPVFILSGILFTGSNIPGWISWSRGFIPLGIPSKLLLSNAAPQLGDILLSMLSTLIWFSVAYLFMRKAVKAATRMGTLEVI